MRSSGLFTTATVLAAMLAGCETASTNQNATQGPLTTTAGGQTFTLPNAGTYSSYVLDSGPEVSIDTPPQLVEGAVGADELLIGACPEKDRDMTFVLTRLDEHTARVAGMVDGASPELFSIYKAQITATGCGAAPRVHNAELTWMNGTEAPGAIAFGLPGETRSLPSFQRDYMPQVAAVTVILNPSCPQEELRNSKIVDTRVVRSIPQNEYLDRRGPAGIPAGATLVETWEESWTLSACGDRHELSAAFGADDRGGLGIALRAKLAGAAGEP